MGNYTAWAKESLSGEETAALFDFVTGQNSDGPTGTPTSTLASTDSVPDPVLVPVSVPYGGVACRPQDNKKNKEYTRRESHEYTCEYRNRTRACTRGANCGKPSEAPKNNKVIIPEISSAWGVFFSKIYMT